MIDWSVFFENIGGIFVLGHVRDAQKDSPRSRIVAVSDRYGAICGSVPIDPDGSVVTLRLNDEVCFGR